MAPALRTAGAVMLILEFVTRRLRFRHFLDRFVAYETHRCIPKKLIRAGAFAMPIVRTPRPFGAGVMGALVTFFKYVILLGRICVALREFPTFFWYAQ